MSSVREKMRPGFRGVKGGLFDSVSKADVGDGQAALAARGVTMLSWADPFYPDPATPECIREAMLEAYRDGTSCHYTMPVGDPELKALIAEKLGRVNGLAVDPRRHILITPGSDSGLFYAMFPFVGDGDEVLLPDPSYPNNRQNIELCGGVPVPVPLREERGFQPLSEDFAARITPRTKMLVLTNPNNPTSTVFSEESMRGLSALCIRHDLICVVDQAFEDMIYDGRELVSLAALPGMFERTVTVFSVSKGMGLSGYRLGYMVADDAVMDALYGAAVSVLGATNTAVQRGVMEAFRHPDFIREYTAVFDRRRRVIHEIMSGVPGISMRMPESAFLCWINVSRLGGSAEVCAYLLEHARVSVNDGNAYGRQGEGYIRVVFGCLASDEALYDAFRRMAEAFTRLAAEKGIA